MTGFIYFIRATTSGHVKIGFTTGDPYVRLAALQTGNHEELRLFATFIGTKRLERRLHRRFASLREHGEWFAPGPELEGFMCGVRFADQKCLRQEHLCKIVAKWERNGERMKMRPPPKLEEPLCDEDLRGRVKAANALLEAIGCDPVDLPYRRA